MRKIISGVVWSQDSSETESEIERKLIFNETYSWRWIFEFPNDTKFCDQTGTVDCLYITRSKKLNDKINVLNWTINDQIFKKIINNLSK